MPVIGVMIVFAALQKSVQYGVYVATTTTSIGIV